MLKFQFWSNIQKKNTTFSQVCRAALNQSALESFDLCAFNGELILQIQHSGAEIMNFEIFGFTLILLKVENSNKTN